MVLNILEFLCNKHKILKALLAILAATKLPTDGPSTTPIAMNTTVSIGQPIITTVPPISTTTESNEIPELPVEGKNVSLFLTNEMTENFVKKFYNATLDVSSKNSVASAPSAYVTLAALYNGAAGKTDLQLRKVFNIPEKDNVVLVGRDHVNDLKSKMGGDFFTYTIYGEDPQVTYDFDDDSRLYFLTDTEFINGSNPKISADHINNFISERTEGKITDLVQSDEITPETDVIFINGGYFKNEWAKPFEETLMIEASDIDSEDDEALGLYVNGSFVTGSIDGFLAPFVELPYKNGGMKMIIIAPNISKELELLKKALSASGYKGLNKKGEKKFIEILLPKFSSRSKIGLTESVKSMGLIDAFDQRANFSKLSRKPFKITKFVQETVIEVDQFGTVAATATDLNAYGTEPRINTTDANDTVHIHSAQYHNPPFKIDQPFLYLIADNSDNILFHGIHQGPFPDRRR